MCGLAGILTRRPGFTREELAAAVDTMAATLVHRGPDGSGIWADPSAGIALGHRRLSIIDLSQAGAQPMCSDDGRYVLTYNGEVYNFLALRKELEKEGVSFRSTSDTEVVLKACQQWGVVSSLERFVGMFAFALWDSVERELWLVRDRIGEKPLYYGWCGESFLFASELKALRAFPGWHGSIDRGALALLLKYNYIPAPYSIYQATLKLAPGTYLKLNESDTRAGSLPDPTSYWTLAAVAEAGLADRFEGTDEEATDMLEALLRQSVEGQMIADVPIGAFLSGGIDSSTVVSLMQAGGAAPVKTFTIAFSDAAYDESTHAREVACHLGTDHTEIRLSPKEMMEVIPLLPALYDEPFADSSQIPTHLVSRLARSRVRVSLSGDGGDEVFCGYNRQVMLARVQRASSRFPRVCRRGASALLRSIPTSAWERVLRRRKWGVLGDQIQKLSGIVVLDDPEAMYAHLVAFWENAADVVVGASSLTTTLTDPARWPALPDYLERLLWAETVTSLPDDMLVKVDRASMGVGLEVRTPLLDHRVVEFAWRLPMAMKVRNGKGKWILRQVLNRYVPQELIERPKAGFSIPIDEWLRGPLRDWAESLLEEHRLASEGFFDPRPIREKWKQHLDGTRKWQEHLWSVLMFEAWLDAQ